MCDVLMTALRHAQERIEALEYEQYMTLEEFGEPVDEDEVLEYCNDMGIMIGNMFGTPMYRFDALLCVAYGDDEVCDESVH